MNKAQTYRVYKGSLSRLHSWNTGWKVVKAIENGEDFGEIGELVAYIPGSRRIARYLAKYLNDEDRKGKKCS